MNVLADGWTLAQRRLLQLCRGSSSLHTILMMPTVFVMLLGLLFGHAIGTPVGSSYRQYMMPGLFVMTAAVAVFSSMVDVAADTARGVIERLRSLPTNR